MTGLLALVVGVVLASLAQAVLGWWALALVAFGFGVLTRSERWADLRLGFGVLAAGLLRLAWLAARGGDIGELSRILGEVTRLPVAALAVIVPAVVASCAALLGRALGRRVLFG